MNLKLLALVISKFFGTNLNKGITLVKGNYKNIIIVVLAILLIVSIFDRCGKKKKGNSFKNDLEVCQAALIACDTATLTIKLIEPLTPVKLRNIEVPAPISYDVMEIVRLKEQVQRNKLRQIQISGDCELDALEYQRGIEERDIQLLALYIELASYDDTLRTLANQLKTRFYIDSIVETDFVADYEILTAGELKDFKLGVKVKPVLLTRTIKTAAPDPVEYFYKNHFNLKYTPYGTWSNRYILDHKAGLEYTRDLGIIELRGAANYLINQKDYEAEISIVFKPVRWNKKTK